MNRLKESLISLKRNNFLLIILNIFPLFITLIYVILFSVNVPVVHDWLFVNDIMNNDPREWLSSFWEPCNGQRNFLPKLIYLFVFQYFDFNIVMLILINFLVVVLSYLAIYLIFKVTIEDNLYVFLPVSWLFFSLVQYSNLLNAWQISLNLSIMGALFSFYFLQKRTVKSLWIASLFALISYASFGNGLLVFPTGVLFLILSKSNLKIILYWFGLSIITISFYFINYSTKGVSEPSNISAMYLFVTNLLAMATILPFGKLGFIGYLFGSVIGNIILVVTGITLFLFFKKKISLRTKPLLIIVFLYFSFVIFQIALGRSGNDAGLAGAYSTQYTTFVILFLIFLYFVLIYVRNSQYFGNLSDKINTIEKYVYRFLFTIILITLFIGYPFGVLMGPYVYGNHVIQQSLLQTIRNQDPDTYKIIEGTSPDNLIDHVIFLGNRNKSFFSKGSMNYSIFQPIEKSPLRFGNDHRQTTYLGDSLSFNFVCRVNKLENLGLNITVGNAEKKDSLLVELFKGDSLIGGKTLTAYNIYKGGRAFMKLARAEVNCKDSIYEIILKRSGESISIPLYNSYYGGALCDDDSLSLINCSVPAIEYNTGVRMNYYYIASTLRARISNLLTELKNR